MLTITRKIFIWLLAVAFVLAIPLLIPSVAKATPMETYSTTEWFVNEAIQKVQLDVEWTYHEEDGGFWRYTYSFDNKPDSGWSFEYITMGYGRNAEGNIVRPLTEGPMEVGGWLGGDGIVGVLADLPAYASVWVVIEGALGPGDTLRDFYIDLPEYICEQEISMLGYPGKVVEYPQTESIPEPTTLMLLGTGALALGLAFRRKRTL